MKTTCHWTMRLPPADVTIPHTYKDPTITVSYARAVMHSSPPEQNFKKCVLHFYQYFLPDPTWCWGINPFQHWTIEVFSGVNSILTWEDHFQKGVAPSLWAKRGPVKCTSFTWSSFTTGNLETQMMTDLHEMLYLVNSWRLWYQASLEILLSQVLPFW